jgi:hypothetical protein
VIMAAMISMSDAEAHDVGPYWAIATWKRRKEELLRATGARNVISGRLHEWRDPNTYQICASISFRSSAWTGR